MTPWMMTLPFTKSLNGMAKCAVPSQPVLGLFFYYHITWTPFGKDISNSPISSESHLRHSYHHKLHDSKLTKGHQNSIISQMRNSHIFVLMSYFPLHPSIAEFFNQTGPKRYWIISYNSVLLTVKPAKNQITRIYLDRYIKLCILSMACFA